MLRANRQLAFGTGNKNLVGLRRIDDALWGGYPTDGANYSLGTKTNDLLSVIAECRTKQSITRIETEMVDPSLHAGKWDSPCQNQRLARSGTLLCRYASRKRDKQKAASNRFLTLCCFSNSPQIALSISKTVQVSYSSRQGDRSGH